MLESAHEHSVKTDEDRTYYAAIGPMTDVAAVTDLADLPTVPADVAKLVQGLLIHPFWAEAYGSQVPDHTILRHAGRPARAPCAMGPVGHAGLRRRARRLRRRASGGARQPR